MSKAPPQWAYDRVSELHNAFSDGTFSAYGDLKGAFAAYVAEHEEPPVDPLLIEAQKFAESWAPEMVTPLPQARLDRLQDMALAVLRRGIELARNEEAPK